MRTLHISKSHLVIIIISLFIDGAQVPRARLCAHDCLLLRRQFELHIPQPDWFGTIPLRDGFGIRDRAKITLPKVAQNADPHAAGEELRIRGGGGGREMN